MIVIRLALGMLLGALIAASGVGHSTTRAAQTKAAAPASVASAFDGADANHDGKISKKEFLAARNAKFDKIDSNHDGKIDRADFPGAANHQKALAKIDAHIASADKNHDGSISRDELSKSATPFFDKADTNHDGFITTAEVAALRQASRPPAK
jgi:Ca2+-binding EF-hand superfamily protein